MMFATKLRALRHLMVCDTNLGRIDQSRQKVFKPKAFFGVS